MEYILINESKLKIICKEKDLEPYGISADLLEYGDASSRRFLDDLLDEAKSKLGFETLKHRVLIQLFPDKSGGCEIFISKLGLLLSTSDEKPSPIKKASKPKSQERIFFFEKLDFMLEACRRLSFLQNIKKSSAFYIYGCGYYLYFLLDVQPELDEYDIPILDEYSFLLEYGEPKSVKEKLPYLMEYAKCISQGKAIESLGNI